ncbi:intraflagellar transport protein 52 homolog isoform X3 [Choloepus didactylus]|uniref:intraflagellar transport protein 52 homolog isoform X3 n=1 Tax=Choloepus didactylus TaxID=27675 RepID=UPI00189FB25B|nr:intraflagellar transport protein 52 homolog isoform X3 [Choloepus didactylus]
MDSSPAGTPSPQPSRTNGNINLGPSANPNARPTDFDFLKVIGKGNYGKVLLAKRKSDGTFYAVKVLQKKSILKKKELFFHLQRERRFLEPRARFYTAEVASAIGYLHSLNIIYRDLKPENILLDCQGHVVLTDFGLCKEGVEPEETTSTFCGTPEYLAPEVLRKEPYDRAVDWWCLGAVLYEMLHGLLPFYSEDVSQMYENILHQPLQIPGGRTVAACDLLQGLLHKDQRQRLGSKADFLDIKNHVFFSPINWDDLYHKRLTPPFNPNVVAMEKEPRSTILFNASKKEIFTTNNGYKSMQKRLRSNWKIQSLKDEITSEKLIGVKLWITAGPREKFTAAEFEVLKKYLDGGGDIFVMLGEGGESRFDTNINFLLEEYGIMVNNDAVVRNVYYKYFHPKEALVSNGVLNREISRAAGKAVPGIIDEESNGNNAQALTFVYPFGATLSVMKPAVAVLSTGSVCFPLNRPILAFYHSKNQGGKLAVLGSCHMFSDQYLDKEENSKIMDVVFQWLTTGDIHLNQIDAEDPEISDYMMLPDTATLSERLRVCLQEGDENPRDFTTLFNLSIYQLDTTSLPKVIKAHEQLNVKHEPLQLIQPQFETPLPALQPAVFPPSFRELPPPPLELFDLDETFSSEKARLAQITNKCTEEDLEFYVRKCGDILGVTSKLPKDQQDAKHILEHIFFQVVEFKKLNQKKLSVRNWLSDLEYVHKIKNVLEECSRTLEELHDTVSGRKGLKQYIEIFLFSLQNIYILHNENKFIQIFSICMIFVFLLKISKMNISFLEEKSCFLLLFLM